MQKLSREFITVADEVGRLQRGRDAECRFFQEFCEEGHYSGRTNPSRTRQGIYAVAPSGVFLASVNTRKAEAVEETLTRALARWRQLPAERRFLSEEAAARLREVRRWEDGYPEDGLVLRVNSRDLPRKKKARGWHAHAWNQDFAWFDKDEARAFLPAEPKKGAVHEVPAALVQRIARFHLVDNVRGQTSAFGPRNVEKAALTADVIAVEGPLVRLRLRGETRASKEGRWPVRGFRDRGEPTKQEIGFEAKLLGGAAYDLRERRFKAFELVALGTRWGGTQFNGRGRDLEAGGIGVAFTLVDGEASDRVAPAHVWGYWKNRPRGR